MYVEKCSKPHGNGCRKPKGLTRMLWELWGKPPLILVMPVSQFLWLLNGPRLNQSKDEATLWFTPLTTSSFLFGIPNHDDKAPEQIVRNYTDLRRNTGPCTNPCEKALHLPNKSLLLHFDDFVLLWSMVWSTGCNRIHFFSCCFFFFFFFLWRLQRWEDVGRSPPSMQVGFNYL